MNGPHDTYPLCGLCGLTLRSSEDEMVLGDRGRVHRYCTRRGAMNPTCPTCHAPIVDTAEADLHPDGRAWHSHHGSSDVGTIRYRTRCAHCDARIQFGQQFAVDGEEVLHLQCAEERRRRRALDERRRAREQVGRGLRVNVGSTEAGGLDPDVPGAYRGCNCGLCRDARDARAYNGVFNA